MKKTVLALMCLAVLVGCKKTEKPATASEVEEQVMEEVFSGENNTPEAIDYYGKEMHLTYQGLASDEAVAGEVAYVYGASRALTIVKAYDHELSAAEKAAAIEQIYKFVKAEADDNKCVWGFYQKDTKEEALSEKSIEEVMAQGKKNYDMFTWDYAIDGHLFTIDIDVEDEKMTIQAVNGLQKSQNEIWEDLENAMEDEDFQEAVKDALQN